MGATEIAGFPLRNPVSAGTHLLWCALGIFLTALLWKLTGGCKLRRWSAVVFGVSMCLLYGASGLYHSLRVAPKTLNIFRLLDHSMIYVLIAGTYTPICALLLRGRLRVILLATVWGLAVAGIACKWLLAAPPYPVTVGLYVALGWIALLPLRQLIAAIGLGPMAWPFLAASSTPPAAFAMPPNGPCCAPASSALTRSCTSLTWRPPPSTSTSSCISSCHTAQPGKRRSMHPCCKPPERGLWAPARPTLRVGPRRYILSCPLGLAANNGRIMDSYSWIRRRRRARP